MNEATRIGIRADAAAWQVRLLLDVLSLPPERLSHNWWPWFVKRVCRVGVFAGRWPVNWENTLYGYNFAGAGDADHVFLMPPDPRDWLPPQHLAWAVRELDLAPFLAACRADGQGNTAYHPQMMVALVLYCYCKGIRSSRAIEMATFDDVGARVICGGLHPDHATNARFVTRHKEPLKGLLVQSFVASARMGLVRVDMTAGDGTKVKANASMAANATAEQLGLEVAELERLLAAERAVAVQAARRAGFCAGPASFLNCDDGQGVASCGHLR